MSDAPNVAPSSAKSRVPLIAGIVVVVLVVAVGAFFFLTRDDSEPPLKLADTTTAPAGADSGSSTTASGEPASAGDLDGSWTLVAGSGDNATVAGYRVKEVFAAGARKATAVGRTNDVTGSLTAA